MGTSEKEKRLLESEDVQRGLREVGAQLAMGHAGLFIGRNGAGYCVIAGAVARGATPVASGHMVSIGLTEEGLRVLRQRIDSLLGEKTMAPLPDGLIVS